MIFVVVLNFSRGALAATPPLAPTQKIPSITAARTRGQCISQTHRQYGRSTAISLGCNIKEVCIATAIIINRHILRNSIDTSLP
jgi:hypothetical protein